MKQMKNKLNLNPDVGILCLNTYIPEITLAGTWWCQSSAIWTNRLTHVCMLQQMQILWTDDYQIYHCWCFNHQIIGNLTYKYYTAWFANKTRTLKTFLHMGFIQHALHKQIIY